MRMGLRILLGDLRHSTLGRHSVMTPLALGYLASYARAVLGPNALDVTIEDDPQRAIDFIERERPDVVALANYVWNSEVSGLVFGHAKSIAPDTVCIAGGPQFPADSTPILSIHHVPNRPGWSGESGDFPNRSNTFYHLNYRLLCPGDGATT